MTKSRSLKTSRSSESILLLCPAPDRAGFAPRAEEEEPQETAYYIRASKNRPTAAKHVLLTLRCCIGRCSTRAAVRSARRGNWTWTRNAKASWVLASLLLPRVTWCHSFREGSSAGSAHRLDEHAGFAASKGKRHAGHVLQNRALPVHCTQPDFRERDNGRHRSISVVLSAASGRSSASEWYVVRLKWGKLELGFAFWASRCALRMRNAPFVVLGPQM